MRLVELALERYGHFTDRRLAFAADAPLTIVHGRNESGKTTALSAVSDALFGVEARSRYDFKHGYNDMRIGCTVMGADGRRVSFRRRKGNKNTLVGPADEPIGEEWLGRLLRGLDRDRFLDAFALDQKRLREGARRLVEGQGGAGETLLAAAPGLADLIALTRELRAEAEALFLPRRSGQKQFYQALERHERARRALREETLQIDTVRRGREALQVASRQLGEAKEARAAVRMEVVRLGRLRNALPAIAAIDRLAAELAALGGLPPVGAGFPDRCRATLQRHGELARSLAQAEEERDGLAEALSRIAVDDAVLAHHADIEALYKRSEVIADQARDIPIREGEIRGLLNELENRARRIGLEGTEAVRQRQAKDADFARIRALVAARRQLDLRRRDLAGRLAGLEAEAGQLGRDREALGHVADPAPLRRRLQELAAVAGHVRARDDLARQIAEREQEMADDLAALAIPVAGVEALAALAVPAAGVVDEFEERFAALDRRSEALAAEGRRLDERRTEAMRQLADLASAGEVATPEAISGARRRRDLLWLSLRQQLLEPQLPLEVPRMIVDFEAATGEADALADRRQAQSERIEAARRLSAEQSQAEAAIAALEQATAANQTGIAAARADWVALWAKGGIDPRPPREMRAFLDARNDLLRRRQPLEADRKRLREVEGAVSAALAALSTLAANLGVAAEAEPRLMLASMNHVIEDMGRRLEQARLLDQGRKRAENDAAVSRAGLAELDTAEEAWRAEWEAAARPFDIRPEGSLEEAEAVLAAWEGVPTVAADLRGLEHRVTRMREDGARFDAAVCALVAAAAPGLEGLASGAAVQELRRRAGKAREAAVRRDALRASLDRLELRCADQRREHARAAAAIARLLEEAGLADAARLPDMANAIARAEAMAAELSQRRSALLAGSDGASEAELRQGLAALDRDRLAALLEEKEAEQHRLDEVVNAAVRAETQARSALDALESRAGAAEAAQEEKNAVAEIAHIVEEWSRLTAAERLLSAAIETYRAKHQSPVLARAGDAFALATGGAYAGLATDYDEKDEARVVALRADGARLAVEALSEGTADQLFLALRLATLDDHVRRASPVPFLADDLFVSFDEERTEAGLRMLASFGDSLQMIVFTHHRHVVEAGRRVMGSGLDLIEL